MLCVMHSPPVDPPPPPPPSGSALLPWRPSMRNGGTEETGTQQTRVIAILPPALSSEVEENTLFTPNTAFHCWRHCVSVLMNCCVSADSTWNPHRQTASDAWSMRTDVIRAELLEADESAGGRLQVGRIHPHREIDSPPTHTATQHTKYTKLSSTVGERTKLKMTTMSPFYNIRNVWRSCKKKLKLKSWSLEEFWLSKRSEKLLF